MKFISIDEEGYPHFSGVRVTDTEVGHMIIQNMRPSSNNLSIETSLNDVVAKVEAFDYPWVIQGIEILKTDPVQLKAMLPYGVEVSINPTDLRLDEWDRFVGIHHEKHIPFVFSRKAQAQFFELCDEFSDDSVTLAKKRFQIYPQYSSEVRVVEKTSFWDQKYQSAQKPGWELNTHHPSLPHIVSNLKLSKSRILVLGCGSGNDAAYFASLGHIVTAVDFSKSAIDAAKQKYGHLANITWIQGDIFDPHLPVSNGNFDIIFEHTCFCAVSPERRNDLVTIWSNKLHDQGHLLGIFFVMWKTDHPPFGATEWEIKKRTQKQFTPLYWQRLKPPLALESRLGTELLIYARVTRG